MEGDFIDDLVHSCLIITRSMLRERLLNLAACDLWALGSLQFAG